MSTIIITIETDDRALVRKWLAQTVSHRLSGKAYVRNITMSIDGSPPRDPVQIAFGLTDEEFATHLQHRAEQFAAMEVWNAHCILVHQREKELRDAEGLDYEEARLKVREQMQAEGYVRPPLAV